MIKFLSASVGGRRRELIRSQREWFAKAFTVCVLLVCVCAIMARDALNMPSWFENEKYLPAIVVSVAIFKAVYLFVASAAKGEGAFGVENKTTGLCAALSLALVFWGHQIDADKAFFLFAFFIVSLFHPILAIYLYKNVSADFCTERKAVDRRELTLHLALTALLSLSALLASRGVEIYLLNMFHGPGEVAVFSISISLTSMALNFIGIGLNSVTLPALSHAFASSGIEKVGEVTLKFHKLLLFLGLLVAGTLSYLADPLIYFAYGDEYGESVVVLRVLVVLLGCTLSSGLLGTVLTVGNRQGVRMLAFFVSSVFQVVVAVLLIPKFSVWGAVISIALGSFFGYLILIFSVSRTINVKTFLLVSFRIVLCAIVGLSTAFVFVFIFSGLVGSILSAFFFGVFFILLSLAFKIWTFGDILAAEESLNLNGRVSSLLRRFMT